MPNDRSASPTIKGYYYQFDLTIKHALSLARDDDYIIAEGIEDIDIYTASEASAIQCKYHTDISYIPSKIRKPIMLMLSHYVGTDVDIKYTLYAHFEDYRDEIFLSLEDLKNILTYTEKKVEKCFYRDNNIDDETLVGFLENFNFKLGEEFFQQKQRVIALIMSQFGCTNFVADKLYYNNALRFIIDKSKEDDVLDRNFTKAQFIQAIDIKKALYSEWYIAAKGKQTYLRELKGTLFTSNCMKSRTRKRFIVLGHELLLGGDQQMPLSEFVMSLANSYYTVNSSHRDTLPIVVIVDCNEQEMHSLKSALIGNGLRYEDGMEHVQFSASFFNEKPVINIGSRSNRISRSSARIKLLRLETLQDNIINITPPNVLLNFSHEAPPVWDNQSYQVHDIKYCDNLEEVLFVIT